MKLGVTFARLRPSLWPQTAQLCDELGFESVWLPEHLVLPVGATGSPFHGQDHSPVPPKTPVYDVFTMLAFLAARTTQLRLGTNVYNIGLRHPFTTARAVATLDELSGGRVELGVGASWLAAEWEATGLDFATRGRRVDEALLVCRQLWTEPVVEHHGEHFDFAPVMFEPKPVQQPVPVSVGGDSAPARRRAAVLGDGWIPMNTTVDQLPAALAEIQLLRAQAGRQGTWTTTLMGSVTSGADVERAREAGVDRLVVAPWRRSAEAEEGLRAFAAAFL
ncbi:MAG: luciferase [Frankiales bacterium]|nr:luciferase [Frankiales bacterium]